MSKPGIGHPNSPPQQYKHLTTGTSNNMDESQNIMLSEWYLHKEFISYDSIYVKF